MKKYLAIAFIALILSLFQLSFFGELFGRGFTPDLILSFAFAFMFLEMSDEAFFAGFIGGILIDLLGFTIVGSSSLMYVGSLVLFFVFQRYVSKSWSTKIVGFALVSFLLARLKSEIVFSEQIVETLLSLFLTIFLSKIISSVVTYFKKSGYNINKI